MSRRIGYAARGLSSPCDRAEEKLTKWIAMGLPSGRSFRVLTSGSMVISVEDVTVYMARQFDAGAASATAASAIIDGLEGDLRAYLKRPLVEADVTDEVAKVDRRTGRVRLARTPVVSVASFSVDGTVLDPTAYTTEAWGIHEVFTPFWPSSSIVADPVVLVSYRGGLPGQDPESDFGAKARATLKRAAARDIAQIVFEQAPGVARLAVEGTDISFHGGVKAGKGGLTEDELAEFSRWKRRVVRT